MFNGISTLQSNSNFLHFNSKNITKMSYMFYNCSSIIELPDISNLDTSNVTDMSYMFYNCSSLIKLPDISIWNTEKVTDISNMFYNCESLLSLPDISKWDINDTKMDNLFKNCKSLSYLPDLSKWNIDEETVDSGMLVGCKALEVNIIKKGKYNIKFLNCLNSCFKTIKFCTFFILIIFLLILFFLPIGEIISLFNLNKTISFIENPLEYLNIKDNISFIYTNSTRKSIIKISKDEKQFINYYLNFTFINNNITFDNDIKYLKINNIIYAIFFYLLSAFIIIIIFCKDKLTCTIYIQPTIKLVVNILFDIILLINIILNYNIFDRLSNSFNIFFSEIEKLFNVKILEHEKENIWSNDFHYNFIFLNGAILIISLAFTLSWCRYIIEKKVKLINYKNLFFEK